jgi:hypothetical protein
MPRYQEVQTPSISEFSKRLIYDCDHIAINLIYESH